MTTLSRETTEWIAIALGADILLIMVAMASFAYLIIEL